MTKAIEQTEENPFNVGAAALAFMIVSGQISHDTPPGFGDLEVHRTRYAMMSHTMPLPMLAGGGGEFDEYAEAEAATWCGDSQPLAVADALIDMLWIAYGTLFAYFGPSAAAAMIGEVNRANMSKINGTLGDTVWAGEPGASKVLKPPGWTGPNHAKVLAEHGWVFGADGEVIGMPVRLLRGPVKPIAAPGPALPPESRIRAEV